ncbi:helix-turn-helix transcriptional regulator [Paraburkholderia steynii]|nr:helix-turn-helix domain-containing protein [Paraburkholderia steynii]
MPLDTQAREAAVKNMAVSMASLLLGYDAAHIFAAAAASAAVVDAGGAADTAEASSAPAVQPQRYRKMVTTAEAARIVGVSHGRMLEHARDGTCPVKPVKAGFFWEWPVTELRAWAKERAAKKKGK